MLVLQQLDLARSDVLQPGGERRRRVHQEPRRHGVDEDAEHRLDARQLRRAAGGGEAEDDVGGAAVAAQQERPGRLQQGAQGEAEVAGAAHQGRPEIGRVANAELAVAALTGRRRGAAADPERRGRPEAGQVAPPEALRRGAVALLQPADELAVGRSRRQLDRAALALRLVKREDLGEEVADAPAVEQEVVMAPDDLVAVVGSAHGEQAHQRRLPQVEALLAVAPAELLEPPALLGCAVAAPVVHRERQLRLREDDLEGLIELLPVEAGAQDRMAIHHLLPCQLEGIDVEPPSSRQQSCSK